MADTQTYEGMFLLDAGQGFEQASEPVRGILDRHGAEILACKPWDERRLAYEIKGRTRGFYVLTYFKADPANVVEIEHDAELSENILRLLILRKERLAEEEINAETPATSSAGRRSESGDDRGDDDDRGGRRRRDDRRDDRRDGRRSEPRPESRPGAEGRTGADAGKGEGTDGSDDAKKGAAGKDDGEKGDEQENAGGDE